MPTHNLHDPGVKKRAIDSMVKYLEMNPASGVGDLLKWCNKNHYPPLIEWVRLAKREFAQTAGTRLLVGAGNVVRSDGSVRTPVLKATDVAKLTVPKPIPIEVPIVPTPAADQPQTETKFIVPGVAERMKYAEDVALENPLVNHTKLYAMVKEKFGVGVAVGRLDEIINAARDAHGLHRSQRGVKRGSPPRKASDPLNKQRYPKKEKELKTKPAENGKLEVKFVDALPPQAPRGPKTRPPSKAAQIVAQLMDNPGKWAAIQSGKAGALSWLRRELVKLGAECAHRGNALFARVVKP